MDHAAVLDVDLGRVDVVLPRERVLHPGLVVALSGANAKASQHAGMARREEGEGRGVLYLISKVNYKTSITSY